MSALRVWSLGVLLALGLGVSGGWAESTSSLPDQDPVEAMLGRHNLHPAIAKFSRGVSNVLGGWLEIPLNIEKRYAAGDAAASLVSGTVYGAIKGVVRTGVGVYETVFFFLPYPNEFAPILPTLGYFQQKDIRNDVVFQ